MNVVAPLGFPAASPLILEAADGLAPLGLQLEPLATVTDLLLRLRGNGARLLLLDWDRLAALPAEDRDALRAACAGHTPVFLAQDGDLSTRLAALRFGGRGFFPRPLDIWCLRNLVQRLASADEAEPGRVLIVDDSASSAAFHARVLGQAGLAASALTEPLRLLDRLREETPDLILMDLYMPGASGEELAGVIRQQPAWAEIPIVFLSAESDPWRQRQALARGGDEFLHKSIAPELLVAAVRDRIARYRELRRLIGRDALTGLYSPEQFSRCLAIEMARARRAERDVSLALLDIDRLGRINEAHGLAGGDRVLKSLARLLRQRLRRTDVLARQAGGGFAVAMPDTPLAAAAKVVDGLREVFLGLPQGGGDRVFQVAFSGGVAHLGGEDRDGDGLFGRALAALREAKRAGRNRVVAVA